MKKVITLLLLLSSFGLQMHKPLKEWRCEGQVGLNLQDGGTEFSFLLILNWEMSLDFD
jgi:hypothetical protein